MFNALSLIQATVEPQDASLKSAGMRADRLLRAAGFKYHESQAPGFQERVVQMYRDPETILEATVNFAYLDFQRTALALAFVLFPLAHSFRVQLRGPGSNVTLGNTIYSGNWRTDLPACVKWLAELRAAVQSGDRRHAQEVLLQHAERTCTLYSMLQD